MSETEDKLPRIYTVLPDEIRGMHPHGQWVFDAPGLVLNFACDIAEDHFPIVEPWARKVADFLASDDGLMEYESPHLPGVCYLHRAAAEHIVSTNPAWSAKVMARDRGNGSGVRIVNEEGLPVVRKLRN